MFRVNFYELTLSLFKLKKHFFELSGDFLNYR